MRIRSIKPDFWRDEVTGVMPPDVALFYIGLASYADDEGRFLWSSILIRSDLDPYGEKWGDIAGIEKVLATLQFSRRIFRYTVEDRTYGWIPTQTKHQHPNRPTKSHFPPPPHDILTTTPERLTSTSLPEGRGVGVGIGEGIGGGGGGTAASLRSPAKPACLPGMPEADPWALKPTIVANWQSMYPRVNVEAEIEKAKSWVHDNASRKPKSVVRFMGNWLLKEANDPRYVSTVSAPRPSAYDQHDKIYQELINAERERTVVRFPAHTRPNTSPGRDGDGGKAPANSATVRALSKVGEVVQAASGSVLGDRGKAGLIQDSHALESGPQCSGGGPEGANGEPGDDDPIPDAGSNL